MRSVFLEFLFSERERNVRFRNIRFHILENMRDLEDLADSQIESWKFEKISE